MSVDREEVLRPTDPQMEEIMAAAKALFEAAGRLSEHLGEAAGEPDLLKPRQVAHAWTALLNASRPTYEQSAMLGGMVMATLMAEVEPDMMDWWVAGMLENRDAVLTDILIRKARRAGEADGEIA